MSESAAEHPPFPSLAGALYAVGGGIAGLIAFAPAALLAWLMMGRGGDTAGCDESTGSGLVGIVVAVAVFLIPLAGGFVSALRGGAGGLIAGVGIGLAVMALEWIVVLGMVG